MNQLSGKAKHRLRIAARLLRQDGVRFGQGNFYEAVVTVIKQMGELERAKLRGLVDWLESYELAESVYWDDGSLPRVRKSKHQSGKRKSEAAAPAAGVIEARNEV